MLCRSSEGSEVAGVLLVGDAQLVALRLLRAAAFLESRETLAQQLTGEMQHAGMRLHRQRFGADARAAAEREQSGRDVGRRGRRDWRGAGLRRGRRRRLLRRLLLLVRGAREARDAARDRLGGHVEFGRGGRFLRQVLRLMQRARARRDGLAERVHRLEFVVRSVVARFEQILEAQRCAEVAGRGRATTAARRTGGMFCIQRAVVQAEIGG